MPERFQKPRDEDELLDSFEGARDNAPLLDSQEELLKQLLENQWPVFEHLAEQIAEDISHQQWDVVIGDDASGRLPALFVGELVRRWRHDVGLQPYIITINNQRLTFYMCGQGVPLLFLHGGRVRAKTFREIIERLAKDYLVIAPDIPGYGDSETPHDVWSFVEYADFFEVFLRERDLTDVVVVGYSMGGGIAFNLAARSRRVSQLVLIDSAGLPLAGAKANHHDVRRLGFYLSHPQYFAVLGTLVLDLLRFAWIHRWDWRHIMDVRRRCFETSYEEMLGTITVPTTIVWGQDDWIFPVAVAERFHAKISHARLVIVPGNHDWLLYSPSQMPVLQ